MQPVFIWSLFSRLPSLELWSDDVYNWLVCMLCFILTCLSEAIMEAPQLLLLSALQYSTSMRCCPWLTFIRCCPHNLSEAMVKKGKEVVAQSLSADFFTVPSINKWNVAATCARIAAVTSSSPRLCITWVQRKPMTSWLEASSTAPGWGEAVAADQFFSKLSLSNLLTQYWSTFSVISECKRVAAKSQLFYLHFEWSHRTKGDFCLVAP